MMRRAKRAMYDHLTSVHQELVGGPHDLRGGDLVQEPGLLCQLLLCLLLHLAGAGLVVVEQGGEGGKGGQRLHRGVNRGEQGQFRAILSDTT